MLTRLLVSILVLLAGAGAVRADAEADCAQRFDSELRISGCTQLIGERKLAPDKRAQTYRRRASAYVETRREQAAARNYTDAIALKSDYALAYAGRARAKMAMRDMDGAIADYTAAIRIGPGYVTALVERGYAYMTKGEHDLAVTDFTDAIRNDPDNAVAYNNRGLAQRTKGALARAVADFSEAIRVNPDYALAYTNRGYAYAAWGEGERAAADFRAALSLDPSLTGARTELRRLKADKDLPARIDAALRSGRALVGKYCARCHAAGPKGSSPNAKAPALRNLHSRFPILSLRQPLTRGITNPHQGMPHFELSGKQITDILAYVNSLAPGQ